MAVTSDLAETQALKETLAKAQESIAAGQLHHAAAIADAALRRGLRHPLLYNLRAYDLEEQTRYPEALAVLQQALELSPDDPQTLHAIGLCLNKLSRPLEALVAFQASLQQRPGFAPTLHHMGVAYEALGNDQEAERCYRAAAEGDAAFPDPWAGLASVAARRGRSDEARGYAERALAIDPANSTAAVAVATADLSDARPEAAQTRLQHLLTLPGVYPPDRASILNLLGDALDAQDQIGPAYNAYVASKSAYEAAYARMLAGSVDMKEAAERTALNLDALKGWRRSPPEPARPDAPAVHVFLVGFPRSGTTLLEQVLAANPAVVALSERATLEALVGLYLTPEDGWDKLMALQGEDLAAARARYWEPLALSGLDVAGKVFIDKLPLNTLRLPLIARLFPNAKILFAERDPRDVVWSCFHRNFSMNAAMAQFTSLARSAAFYDAVMRVGEAARAKLPQDLHVVRYESVVEAFETEAKAVCAFLGLPWVDAMRDFAAAAADRPIATPSARQVRRGLYREGIGQWRRYDAQMQPVLPILEPWVKRFGYAP